MVVTDTQMYYIAYTKNRFISFVEKNCHTLQEIIFLIKQGMRQIRVIRLPTCPVSYCVVNCK